MARISEVIDDMSKCIQQEIDRMDGTQCNSSDDFKLPGFWFHLDYAAQMLANEVTKLSLHYSKPPYPSGSDLTSMFSHLRPSLIQFTTVYHSLPKQTGQMLYKEVTLVVNGMLNSILDFVRSLTDLSEKGAKSRLSLTGSVWAAYNQVSEIPRDNVQATLAYLKDQYSIVTDALQEIDEALKQDPAEMLAEGDVDNLEMWNDSERELATSGLGIIKTAKSCLKRVQQSVRANGSCETYDDNCQLDTLCNLVKDLSPAVDDFVQEIYHPMNMNSVRTKGADLALVICKILNHTEDSHYSCEEDMSWLDFLRKAVAYNNNKLQPLATIDPLLLINNLNLNS